MKKIGFYHYYETVNQNRMFEDPSTSIYGDEVYATHHLFEVAKKRGFSLSTIDTEPLESYDAVFFLDFPKNKNPYYKKLVASRFEKMYLVLLESDVIRPDNSNRKNHIRFKKVFTYNDSLIDNTKYFKLNLPNRIPEALNVGPEKREGFCVMIAGNKSTSHPLGLYAERERIIRWFENTHPSAFDLYGRGWNRYLFKGPKPARVLNRLKFLQRFFCSNYPSYRGEIGNKTDFLQRYKFCICYENARGIPGYISEKIFDCFFAGCVPVYWGAPNITDHIPDNAFIDRRHFSSHEELYSFLKHMPDSEYGDYRAAIKTYIEKNDIYPFSAECFVRTLLKTMEEDLI